MAKMTLRKVAADRKLCDAKITKLGSAIVSGSLAFSGFMVANKPKIAGLDKDEFAEKCKSNWQQFCDLVDRRDTLNSLNVQYFGGRDSVEEGSTFIVKIPKFRGCNEFVTSEMECLTIAQAISRKTYINNFLRPCLAKFIDVADKTLKDYERKVETQNEELLKQVNKQYGSDSTQTSKQRIEYQEAMKPLFAVTLIDPLNIKEILFKAIDNLESYVNTIDSAISKATELTEIEVPDNK